VKNILIIQPQPFKGLTSMKGVETETANISFLCYKNGYRFVEVGYWDLIIIDGCLDNLDSRFLKVIETHSKCFLVL